MEKRTMTSKQWLAAFIATPAAAALLVLAFNFIMDPFCAFGDRFFQWWAYGETLNPRVAKIEYLEQHHQEYDSYIIGSSSASSYPVEKLNELFDAKFYNAFMYGSDLYDVELMSRYIVENYEVKYLLLSLYIQNASQYNVEPDPLTYGLHYRADGSKPLDYLKKYLFLHPRYSLEKLRRCLDDSYLTRAYDVFDPDTGAYDKKTRDVEPIGDLDSYLALPAYAGFASYPPGSLSIPRLEECMASVRAIKELCEARGVELIVACPPMYHEFMSYFTREDAAAFSRALAQVTDYWDFTLSPVSFEPRYFYDETHFRNCVGGMAVAKMAGSSSVYVPEGFGHYVTSANVEQVLEAYWGARPLALEAYTAQVPILRYPRLTRDGGGGSMEAARFAAHMEALAQAGCTAVTFQDLKDYVEAGRELPEKPVAITLEGGGRDSPALAYPILKELGQRATLFVSGAALPPEAADYSGLIAVESQGFNPQDAPGRQGTLQKEGEPEEEYIQFLRQDCQAMDGLFQAALGRSPGVAAPPDGAYSLLRDLIWKEEGIYASVSSDARTNTLVKGLPQCLRAMGSYSVDPSCTAGQLLALLED